jgi:hypothetical protein
MARALGTLETGELRSKPGAIRWALEYLPGEWHETICSAEPTLAQTIELLNYTIRSGGSA